MPCSRPPHVSLSDPPVLVRIVPEHAMLWVVGVWATQTMPVSGLSKRRGRLSQIAALSVKTHVPFAALVHVTVSGTDAALGLDPAEICQEGPGGV